MIEALSKQDSVFDNKAFTWYTLTRVFGADQSHKHNFLDAETESHASLDIGLQHTTDTTINSIMDYVPSLVSFSKSVIDQSLWERFGCVSTTLNVKDGSPGSQYVEATLISLVRNFVGSLVTTSLLGSDFVEQYPSFLEDLQDFDAGFKYLMVGCPRWFAIRSLMKAHLARQRLKIGINASHSALDRTAAGDEPSFPWTADMGDVSALMTKRNAIWSAHELSPETRGACDLELLWRSFIYDGPRLKTADMPAV